MWQLKLTCGSQPNSFVQLYVMKILCSNIGGVILSSVRYKVLTALKISMLSLEFVTLCGLVGRRQCFGETYCFHLQGWRWFYNPEDHYLLSFFILLLSISKLMLGWYRYKTPEDIGSMIGHFFSTPAVSFSASFIASLRSTPHSLLQAISLQVRFWRN
jgi:hypothetical protein